MTCNVPTLRSSPSLGEVLHENLSNLQFDPQLLGSWVVMNIIYGVAREGLPMCTCPTKSGPKGVNAVGEDTYEHGVCGKYMNVYCWGKNARLKGLLYNPYSCPSGDCHSKSTGYAHNIGVLV